MEHWVRSEEHPPAIASLTQTEARPNRLVSFPYDRVLPRTEPRGAQRAAFRGDAGLSTDAKVTSAIEQLRRRGPALLAADRGEDLLAWTDWFPPAIRAREPWVLHFHAVGLRLTSDAYAGAVRMQEQARETFLARDQADGAARALVELGLLAMLRDAPDDACRLLRQAEREADGLDRFLIELVRSTLAGITTRPAATGEALLGRDDAIRARLARALATERLTPHGLAILRDRYGLTPAETSVFVAYYLGHPVQHEQTGETSMRRELALRLNLSENTLMHHVTSIRRKLGLEGRKGSATVLMWCLTKGITTLRAVTAAAP